MEKTSMIPQADGLPELFVRHLPAMGSSRGHVLYVHGATFPSGLSVGFKFDGCSWMDKLSAAGFDAWSFDFVGYGHSGRYPEMAHDPEGKPPLGRAPVAAKQIEKVVRFILEQQNVTTLSLIAHSWGTIAAGLFATQRPEWVNRLLFFGPITQREPQSVHLPDTSPAWFLLTAQAQYERFVADVPAGHPMVLLDRHFAVWAAAYLATDRDSRSRIPPSVKTPGGPRADIAAAWHGALAYDPASVRAPLLIARGEWDSLCTDADAYWLWTALTNAPEKRDVKISRGTHLMHLEKSRYALYRESITFLSENDNLQE